jgi:trans-aconitate methyltransferase
MTHIETNHLWKAEEYHYNSSAQNEAATQLLQYIQLEGHEQILDVGCGDGKITATLANCVATGSVIGIDISPEMIDFARNSFPKDRYSNLIFFVQDAQSINYSEKFDVIFSSFALQWAPDPGSFFKNAYKSLKSSGYLALTIPLGISSELEESINATITLPKWASYFHKFSPHWHFLADSKYKELLAENQFIPTRFVTIPQTVIFSSREQFEKYVIQWFSYLRPLPQDLKQVFFKQIIDKYLEINPVRENGEVSFKFLRVDIIATKAIL